MVFNSLTFAVFFACVLALHNLPLGWSTKKINLLLASYLFYAAWSPPFVILLWISTVVDWWAAKALVHAERPAVRRAWMLLSVGREPRHAGIFQVRAIPARELHRVPPRAGC
jgi:alginate O-acetyltransferase complex protein AlgI